MLARAGCANGSEPCVLECVQESGDVMVLPSGWSHATLNLRASVGAAREFESHGYHEQ